MAEPNWRIYEGAARTVLSAIRRELGLSHVESEPRLVGESGARWKLDAVAWVEGSDGFLVVEVRRHTSSGMRQEALAALAYRVSDVGASGGIVVSPLPLQRGARRLAQKCAITQVMLSADSTSENYLAEFMGKRFLGASIAEAIEPKDSHEAEVIRGERTDG